MSIGLFSRPAFFVHGLAVTGFHPVFFGQLVQIVPHVVPVSRIPSVRTDAQTKVVASVKMPFAYIAGGDPLIRKTLPDGLYIGPGSERVGKGTIDTWILACENSTSCRAAYGLDCVGFVKFYALPGQSVKTGKGAFLFLSMVKQE